MTFINGTITELTNYLIKRYFSDDKFKDETFVSSVRRWIIRSAEDRNRKKYAIGFNLYKKLETNEQGVKCISMADFERYLFPKWYAYLKSKHVGYYNENLLEDDFERIIGHDDDDPYWAKKADQMRVANNSYLENGMEQDECEDPNIVTEKELHEKGMELMLEGIFEAMYGPFDWASLERDMYESRWYDGGYEPETTSEMIKAVRSYERARHFRNYISTQN